MEYIVQIVYLCVRDDVKSVLWLCTEGADHLATAAEAGVGMVSLLIPTGLGNILFTF